MGRYAGVLVIMFIMVSSKLSAQLNLQKPVDSLPVKLTLKVLPQNFYKSELGYFCKKEIQIQKLTRLPIFFRLGSKEYVDWMERKVNAGKKD